MCLCCDRHHKRKEKRRSGDFSKDSSCPHQSTINFSSSEHADAAPAAAAAISE